MFGALFLALFVPAAMAVEPMVIQLSKIYSSYQALIPLPAGSTVYVGSSDAEVLLRNISITIQGTNYTAFDLSQKYTTGFRKQGLVYPNDTNILIKTTNDDNWTIGLTGVIYIIPSEQTQDVNFIVYDSKNTQTFNITESKATTTLVFFNTQLNATTNYHQPISNSMFSDFKFNNTPISFYAGYPPNSANVQETMFFSNPVKYLDSKNMSQSYMFNNIEPLSISDPVFYIKTKGPISFTIKNAWNGVQDEKTTAKTTTGLLSEYYVNYENRSIAFMAVDQAAFGLNYLYKLYSNVNITLENASGKKNFMMHWALQLTPGSFYSDVVYKTLYLTGLGPYEGQYYIQYFTIQGVEWTTVTPPPSTASSMAPGNMTTTPSTPESTTKSGGAFHLILATALTILFSQ